MRRFVAVFSIFTMCVWILPLGAFIKPSQQKTACDGRRAIHMCVCETPQASVREEAGPQKIVFTSASGVETTEKAASGSGGGDFLNTAVSAEISDLDSKFHAFNFILPQKSFFFVPEPVPKA